MTAKHTLSYNMTGGLCRNVADGYAPVRISFDADHSSPIAYVETLDGSPLPGNPREHATENRMEIGRLYSSGWYFRDDRLAETWQRMLSARYHRARA